MPGRGGGHEQFLVGGAGTTHRTEQVVAFLPGDVQAVVGQGADAHRHVPHELHHAGADYGGKLILVAVSPPGPRAAEAGHPLGDVSGEADAGLLPAVDNVNACVRLGLHYVGGCRPCRIHHRRLVHRLATRHRAQHIHQPLGPGQAAGVGGQDACFAAFHRRLASPEFFDFTVISGSFR